MDSIILWVSILCLGLLIYGPWQTQCEDLGRQEIFGIRAELFDLARSGRMSFDDPDYLLIRRSMNKMIRFMHELTWVRLVYIGFLRGHERRHVRSSLERAVSDISDPELRRDVEEMVVRMGRAVVRTICMRSPFLVLISLVLRPFMYGARSIGALRQWVLSRKDKFYRRSLSIAQRDAEWYGAMGAV